MKEKKFIKCICAWCAEEFYLTEHHYRTRTRNNQKNLFCDKSCAAKFNTKKAKREYLNRHGF